MIRTLPPRAKQVWPQMLHTLTFMYNSTAHETTGFPPFYLMFGRVPRLPVDVLFKSALKDDCEVLFPQYVEDLKSDLHEAMVLAEKHASGEQRRQANIYNRRVKGVEIEPGDRVLLANKGERERKKLADRWGGVVYTVVNKNPRTHTFEVRDPISGQSKVVHRNLLLCVIFLPVLPEADDSASLISSRASFENEAVDLSTERITQPDCAADQTDRTQDWVSRIPVGDEDHLPKVLEPPAEIYVLDDDHDDVCAAGLSTAVGVPSNAPVPDDSLSCQSDPEHAEPDSSVKAASGHYPESVTTVWSRAGHVIRPVSRLIQTMNGQKLHTQTNRLKTWASSLFSVYTVY